MAKFSGCDEIKIESDDDRISELPACILQNILIRLSRRNEARCSVLSRSWSKLISSWLHQRTFDFEHCCPNRFSKISTKDTHQTFINYVDKSFQKLPEGGGFIIAKFGLKLRVIYREDVSFVDRWLALAAKQGVQRLSLEVGSDLWYHHSVWYTFPKIGFASVSSSLLDSKLTNCTLKRDSLSLDNDSDGAPFALQRLSLINVVIKNPDGAFQNFISRCTSLEYLRIHDSTGLQGLLIQNHIKLKELDVKFIRPSNRRKGLRLEKVDVDSLALETLRMDGMLHKPLVVSFSRCVKLRHLYICNTIVDDQFLRNLVTNFPLLQTLSLESCEVDRLCVIRHPLLETLRLLCNGLDDVELNTPNLLNFEYAGATLPKTLFLSNGPSYLSILKETNLDISLDSTLSPSKWFPRLWACLAQLNTQVVNLSLEVHTLLNEPNVDIFRRIPTHHLTWNVEVLKICAQSSSGSYAAGFFDGLFWCCHPKKILLTHEYAPMELFKFAREIAISTQEDPGCCNSSHFKCWRHILKVTAINTVDTTDTALLEPLLPKYCKEVALTLSWS